ncbi:hypothetical protein Tco_0384914 [Tanacetum coccineum]
MLKFPVAGGILKLKSSKIIPIECAAVSKVKGQPLAISQAVEERIKVAIHPEYPEQTIMFGSTLTEDGRSKLCDLLRRNLDVFAWKPADMTGVPRHIAEHRLNVREGCPPIRQNKRDDLVIKSHTEGEIIRDIEETFKTLREINMKLNPKKCTFEVEEGMFLGYKVNTKGIKVCPDKADAVLSLPSLKCLKDVQKLNGKLASLNRFLAKLAEKSLPPRVSVKGQILADFIVERPEEDSPIEVEEELPEPWILFTDGSSCADGFGAGIEDSGTNGCEKSPSKCGFTTGGKLVVEEEGNTWMTPIQEYLTEEILPVEADKERAVRRKSQRFALINEVLYKKSFLGPWLRCVGPLQANYVLKEIHEGSCSMHASTRSGVAKALQIGYYWPIMHKDARVLKRGMQSCRIATTDPEKSATKVAPNHIPMSVL